MKDILIFCPSIEYGGVGKNLFITSNYLAKKYLNKKIYLISANNDQKKKFSSKIKLFIPSTKRFNNSKRLLKSLISILIFIKNFRKKDIVILSFQSNIIAILLAKIFDKKVIIRSNTSPEKFANNFFKKFFFKNFFKLSDKIIVNSLIFKKKFKNFFNLDSICIYNSIVKKYESRKNKNNKIKYLKIINVGRLTDQKDQLTL